MVMRNEGALQPGRLAGRTGLELGRAWHMLHLREFLADAFCKSQSTLFDALSLPWQRVHVQLFTPHVQDTGWTEGVGMRGLQPRSN